ncbi:gamma-glutamylcyclotransferase-like [Pristis pectinata]|uniref:gamma-glutamylcyclotransferase-like n=1 Tax=Pristis pectinata TaxID=685728 RepID=UPI00223E2A04|nr:gamma-glutamylcyclotransferase-like [Pristis pectinata]
MARAGVMIRIALCLRGFGFVFAMIAVEKTQGLVGGEDFLYFAYGSNMLQGRLQLLNPSAVRVSVGCLKGYKLAFGHKNTSVTRWGGGVATIIPSPNDEVWGVIWRLKTNDRQSLDDQEGVQGGIYSPMEVKVEQEDMGEEIICLTYQMNHFNSSLASPLYKEVIVKGARESGLPAEYIKKLDTILTNNYNETTPFTIQIIAILHQEQNNTSI